MGDFHFIDIYATKGVEYLLIVGFLITLVFAWRYLNQPPSTRTNSRGE